MRKISALLTAAFFSLVSLPVPPSRAQAVTDALSPNTFTFSDIGGIGAAGSVADPNFGQLSWSAGTPPAQLFNLGMFQSSFGFQNLSLTQIQSLSGQPVTDAPLSSFGLVQGLTVSQLASAVPGLADQPVQNVPPIAAIAAQQGVVPVEGTTIGSIAPFVQGPISQLGGELVNYGVSQIPGLSNIPISNLPGWATAQISSIPGLDHIPLINPLTLMDYFVPFDIGFGMSPCNLGPDCHERNIDNTASGNLDNLSIPCTGATQSCAHIEVKRWNNNTNNIRWISKEQQVSGGNGFLCSKEPTGRFPFGENPKVVVEKIKEHEGEVDFALYFSVDGPFGSKSAHCFGPFPLPFWGTRKEGDLIVFGPDTLSANSPLAGLLNPSVGPSGCAASSGPVAAGASGGTYKGINIDALKTAISNRESRGTGGYQAIGSYVNNDGAGNHGRALGKYQFMSYGPARDIIAAKPGGAQFLASVDSPSGDMSALSAVLPQLFTSAEQEGLMNSHLQHLVDVAQSQGLQGNDLIAMIAAKHEGGDGVTSISDKQYSDSVVDDYNSGGGTVASSSSAIATVAASGCGASAPNIQPTECNGKKLPYIRPTQGPVTSKYGWRGLFGKADFHPGVDIANAIGTPIVASNCGVVDEAGWRGGYGNYTCINHGGGIETCYGHQSVIEVKVGQTVKQGQVIGLMGSTGRSTGPHVHFEFRINGPTVDPTYYVPI